MKRAHVKELGRHGPEKGHSLGELSRSGALGPQGNNLRFIPGSCEAGMWGPQRKQIFSSSTFLVPLVKKGC